MPEYRVTYSIDVDADGPVEAAEQVAQLLLENARHGVYEVVQSGGSTQLVDLDKIPPADLASERDWVNFPD